MNTLKIIAITLLGFFISINAFGQQSRLYSAAYKYIKKHNKNSDLIVSDSLVHNDIASFFEELSIEWHQKPLTTMKFLDSLDQQSSKNPIAHKFNFKNLQTADTTKLVYFSDIEQGWFLAEVVYEKKKAGHSYKSQTDFGQGTIYLFMLDKKHKIRKVYKKVIAYN